jgi:2-dehydropantoate 2-reductase
MAVKWSKLFFNLSNALFAVLGLSTREGFRDEKVRLMVADLLEEANLVVGREGIDIRPLSGRKTPEEMIAGMRKPGKRTYDLPGDEDMKMHSSTWQDLHLGRGRTEVEFLNGEIVRLGEKHGIDTPLNRLMVRAVNRMAREGRKPGYYHLDRLSALMDADD